MKKTASKAGDWDDIDELLHEPKPKGFTHKIVKEGRRIKRGERKMEDVGAWGHLGWIVYDDILLPHKFGVVVLLLILSNFLWFWFK